MGSQPRMFSLPWNISHLTRAILARLTISGIYNVRPRRWLAILTTRILKSQRVLIYHIEQGRPSELLDTSRRISPWKSTRQHHPSDPSSQPNEIDPKTRMADKAGRKHRAKLPKVKTGCVTCRFVVFLWPFYSRHASLTSEYQNATS